MMLCGASWRLVAAGLAFAFSQQLPARAEPQHAGTSDQVKAPGQVNATRPSASAICHVVSQAAADNELPLEFFTRLIWQESRFNPDAVSPKGAQGIAQFMPGTASGRGLDNPFEPVQALREAASYLRELRITFRGSLGLAAAAYNAGPGRVEAWLGGRGGLPAETRAYVRAVTGHDAEAWASQSPPQWEPAAVPKGGNCIEVAKLITAAPRPSWALPRARRGPLGVCSSPATGRRGACLPPTSGCAALTIVSCVTDCHWCCGPSCRVSAVLPSSLCGSRKAPA